MPPKRIAILGGGIAGVTAAWQLAQLDPTLDVTLFEASSRLGGTVETIRRDGFVIETGPDGWITEKPWARELAIDLGLASELIPSNDATRVTWILRHGRLEAIPDGMRMMVPTDLAALHRSPLFSPEAIRAYEAEPERAEELRGAAPDTDESVATFVARHFGRQVLDTIAAPLLSGVFGGDVAKLSVRAVMPNFVQMERSHGSLIAALRSRPPATLGEAYGTTTRSPQAIFTTLRSGTQTLIDRMAAAIPPQWLCLDTHIDSLEQSHKGWVPHSSQSLRDGWDPTPFDHLSLAVPAHVAGQLLPELALHLPQQESSAIIAAYAFTEEFPLPKGFGFLVPHDEPNTLLAGTFVDQKYTDRVPPNCRLLRAFIGGSDEPANDLRTDDQLAAEAFADLEKILGKLPPPAFTVVRRWPRSLPQYAVGHGARIAQLEASLPEGLHLLGNPYRGVGLPDLIRDARATARQIAAAT